MKRNIILAQLSGRYNLSYMRPDPACRTFNLSAVEDVLTRMQSAIADPDLYRLFQNSYPNTLDTAIKWRGTAANNSAEELTLVITGDINAMWLRDSANQMQSYLPLLEPDGGSSTGNGSTARIASLYRGVINLQARYLLISPFCNSFQVPAESGIPPATNGAAADDTVTPPYDPARVFECKYELDSLAAFLEVSADYYAGTGDAAFFGRFQWPAALRAALGVATAMRDTPTYAAANGNVLRSPYVFTRQTTRATETLANGGLVSPVASGTSLVRSAFRPNDDSTIFQLLEPANMMFARYLEPAAEIAAKLGDSALADGMRAFAAELRRAIDAYAVVPLGPTPGSSPSEQQQTTVYAYEVDGFGSAAVMDDANIASLLAAPLFGYLDRSDATYAGQEARHPEAELPGRAPLSRVPTSRSDDGMRYTRP